MIYTVVRSLRHMEAAGKIATALRWTPAARGAMGQVVWYQGTAQGRRAAVRVFARLKQVGLAGGNGPRWSASLRLHVVMEVTVRTSLGVSVHCPYGSPRPRDYPSGYTGDGVERVPSAVQQALLQFAQAGVDGRGAGGVPLARHLHLVDRAAVPSTELHPDVLRHARVVLLHENPNSLMDMQAVSRLLFEMATVAYAVERAADGR
jgi:hypothetical protein